MWVAFSLACGAFASLAEAETQYTVLKGKEEEVCQVYGQNLNSFRHLAPMWCERELNPALPGLRKPAWHRLDVWEHREVVKDIHRFLEGIEPNDPHELPSWEKGIKDQAKRHHLGMALALIDIDNDGNPDHTIRYFDGSCLGTRKYGTSLLVLNADQNALDIRKTMHLMQNPRDSEVWTLAGIWGGAIYDVFLYKEKTYFDRVSTGPHTGSEGLLQVFTTDKHITREICLYQYQFDK
jgi:hypothetical protein